MCRLRADLTLCYKILHGIIPGPPEKFGLCLASRQSRGYSLKLAIQYTRVDTRKFYFANRICAPWNFLRSDIVEAKSVLCFKRLLRNCDLGIFLTFDCTH